MNTFASHASKSFTPGDRTKAKIPDATEVSRIAELLHPATGQKRNLWRFFTFSCIMVKVTFVKDADRRETVER